MRIDQVATYTFSFSFKINKYLYFDRYNKISSGSGSPRLPIHCRSFVFTVLLSVPHVILNSMYTRWQGRFLFISVCTFCVQYFLCVSNSPNFLFIMCSRYFSFLSAFNYVAVFFHFFWRSFVAHMAKGILGSLLCNYISVKSSLL